MSTVTSTYIPKTVRLPPASRREFLEPAPIFDVTKLSDERTQTLRRLLEEGHITVAPLRNPKLILHSHLPHVCPPPPKSRPFTFSFSNRRHLTSLSF